MTTIGIASVKGAGGVTSAALVLAAVLAEREPTLLVEADPSGGSLLSWCDQLQPAGDLYDVTMSRNSAGLTSIAQRVGDVSVVPSWGRSFRLTQALIRPRVPWRVLFGEHAGSVVVDVGRVHPDAAALGLLAACDLVVLVAASEPAPVATTMEWSSRGGRHGSADVGVPTARLRMITSEVVGRRRTMSVTPRDLSLVTGAEFLGHLPHDPASLDLLCRGASTTDRSLRRSRLVESARLIAGPLGDGERRAVHERRREHRSAPEPVRVTQERVDGQR